MQLFDQKALSLRRARALRRGFEPFLYERALADVFERLQLIQRGFPKALLVGTLEPSWRERLLAHAAQVDAVDAADLTRIEPGAYDLAVALEGLDTVQDLPHALLAIRFALKGDSFFIGALPGGDTLPALRAAMRVADKRMGVAAPHVHPRIEPAGLAGLLSDAGFSMPVVDVDRVEASYRSFAALVADLRSMAATNALSARSRKPLSRAAAAAAAVEFESRSSEGRVRERFEVLHFAAWTPARGNG